jgi:hypothetical protein
MCLSCLAERSHRDQYRCSTCVSETSREISRRASGRKNNDISFIRTLTTFCTRWNAHTPPPHVLQWRNSRSPRQIRTLDFPKRDRTVQIHRKFPLPSQSYELNSRYIQTVLVVPPVALLMAKSPITSTYDLSSIKTIMCGAAPLSSDLQAQLEARLPGRSIVVQGYGTSISPSLWIEIQVVDLGQD